MTRIQRRIRTVAGLLFALAFVLAACGPDVFVAEYESELAGENEVPAVATPATGGVTATLTDNNLVLVGAFSALTSDLTQIAGSSAHVHAAPAGENGPIVGPLLVTSVDGRNGTLAGELDLTDAEVEAFLDGGFYVNIHTVGNPSGELRAQLDEGTPTFADVTETFDALLLPDHEVPPVTSPASGTAAAILRADDTLTVSGSFMDLDSPLTDVGDLGPAHVHEGAAGVNGPVEFPLEVAAAADDLSGRFGATVDVTADQIDTLRAAGYYVNVHTEANPGGEVRGQLFVDPIEATATLGGDQEVPAVTTPASGEATATASGTRIVVSGSFDGLESALTDVAGTPAHIHVADAGATGPVVFPLVVDADTDLRGGTFTLDTELTEAQRADFLAGRYYVNVHTVDHPGGEIRGQLEVQP